MSLNVSQSENEIWSQTGAIVYDVFTVIILVILGFHGYNVYQDLYTQPRKSVTHRKSKPAITSTYKFIVIGTLISILHAAAAIISATYSWFLINDKQCRVQKTLVLVNIQAQKTWMYSIFLTRLYTVYCQSAYSYSKKCIGCCIAAIVLYGICMIIGIITFTGSEIHLYGDNAYPNWCGPKEGLFIYIGMSIYMQDLIVSIGFIVAFMSPLLKTAKAISDRDTHKSSVTKILYAGTKVTILTISSCVSTLIFPAFTIALGVGMFSAIDLIINPICMILMTSYYKDSLYYQRICAPCIACAHKKAKTNDDEEAKEDPQAKDLEPSSTVPVTTDQTKPIDSNSTDTNYTLNQMNESVIANSEIEIQEKSNAQPVNQDHDGGDNEEP